MSSYIRLQQMRKNRQLVQRKAYYRKMFLKQQKLGLEKFNNIDNPFYLWAKGKKL